MVSQESQVTLVEEHTETEETSGQRDTRQKSWKSINRLFGALRLAPSDASKTMDNQAAKLSTVSATSTPTRSTGSDTVSTVTHIDTQTSYHSLDTKPPATQESGSAVVEKQRSKVDSQSPTLPPYEEAILSGTGDKYNDEDVLYQATAFVESNQAIPDVIPSLAKPVLIPRISRGATAPIARAWPPDIADHAINKEKFVEFIDNLNILSQPPVQAMALHIAAIGVSVAPFDGADGVAQLTEAAAVALSRYIVHARCVDFMSKLNSEYFHPRRLHARMLYSKAMRKAANIPDDDPLVAPLAEHTVTMSPHERCVEHMRKYSCELSYDVPPLSPQTRMLSRLAAWNVRYKTKRFDKVAMSARKREWKKHCRGKKLKREGKLEKRRAERLQWLVIQNLEEYELEERVKEEEKMLRTGRRKTSTWSTIRSSGSGVGARLRSVVTT